MRTNSQANSTAALGTRLLRSAFLLVAVVVVLTLACDSNSADKDAFEEPVVALEQASDAVVDEASSSSSESVEGGIPRFATKFSTPDEPKERGDLKIATLLPRDAIPSIDSPEFVDIADANEQMDDEDLVIGVSIEGEHKAYSTAFLSSHEIVNDVVGGKPVAVTW